MTFSKTPLPASSAVGITELLLRSQTEQLAMNSRNSLVPTRSKESQESIIERADATFEEDDEDFFDDTSIDQAHAMTSSKTPLPSTSALDVSELRLRNQNKRSRNSLSPPSRSRENLLSVLERSIADLDEQDFEDCDDVNIDTIDWGRSSRHRHYDSHSHSGQ
jgi:hypothetical protein